MFSAFKKDFRVNFIKLLSLLFEFTVLEMMQNCASFACYRSILTCPKPVRPAAWPAAAPVNSLAQFLKKLLWTDFSFFTLSLRLSHKNILLMLIKNLVAAFFPSHPLSTLPHLFLSHPHTFIECQVFASHSWKGSEGWSFCGGHWNRHFGMSSHLFCTATLW